MKYKYLLIILIFLIVAALSTIQNFFASLLGYTSPTVATSLIYALILFGLFYLVAWLIKKYSSDTKEPFFFEVSGDKRCSGAYIGKPTSFQFQTVGYGDCKPSSLPLGMIGVDECTEIGGGDKYRDDRRYEDVGSVISG